MPKKEIKPWVKPIEELKAHLDWSQEEMAEALGVGQTAISRWLNGLREPSRQTYEELYFLAGEIPAAKFFWERARLSKARVESLMKGLKHMLANPLPELKTEVLAGQGTFTYVNRWARLIPTLPPVAIPLLKNPAAAGEPRVVAEDVEDVLFFAGALVPHPEVTRCIRVKGDSMSPLLEDDYIITVDTFDRSPGNLVNSMVVARDPDGVIAVKWLRKIGREYVLVPQHTSPRYNPVILSQVKDWMLIGKVLFWIGVPPRK